MQIKIPGHSNCTVEAVCESGKSFIRKSTLDPQYCHRLKLQADKQRKFALLKYPNIRVPWITATTYRDSYFTFDMEYVPSLDFVEYFQQAGKDDVDHIWTILRLYLARNIINRRYATVPGEVLKHKISQVYQQCREQHTIIAEVYKMVPDQLHLPRGDCHGDLTLSNVLFTDSGIAMIDFLDSYIESPVMDIIKLRQDTKHKWSYQLYPHSFDRVKIDIVLDYLDRQIDIWCSAFPFHQYYRVLQAINLLRILPYAQNQQITSFVVREIESLVCTPQPQSSSL